MDIRLLISWCFLCGALLVPFGLYQVIAHFTQPRLVAPMSSPTVSATVSATPRHTATPYESPVPLCTVEEVTQAGNGARVRSEFVCTNDQGLRIKVYGWPAAVSLGQQVQLNFQAKQ